MTPGSKARHMMTPGEGSGPGYPDSFEPRPSSRRCHGGSVQIRCYPAPGRAGTCVLERTVVRGIDRRDVSRLTGDAVASYMAQKISDSVFAHRQVVDRE